MGDVEPVVAREANTATPSAPAEIIAVATREFADNGYAGARVDEIAAKMSTTKRMFYYYFGDKERLYVEVLARILDRGRGRRLPR
jgi:AcrR family transcriptional regulator